MSLSNEIHWSSFPRIQFVLFLFKFYNKIWFIITFWPMPILAVITSTLVSFILWPNPLFLPNPSFSQSDLDKMPTFYQDLILRAILINNFFLYIVSAGVNLILCWLSLSVIFIITLIKGWELGFVSSLFFGGKNAMYLRESRRDKVWESENGKKTHRQREIEADWERSCSFLGIVFAKHSERSEYLGGQNGKIKAIWRLQYSWWVWERQTVTGL